MKKWYQRLKSSLELLQANRKLNKEIARSLAPTFNKDGATLEEKVGMTVEEVIEMDMFAISVVRKLREKGHDEHAVMTRLLQTLSCQGYSETRLLIAGVKLEIYMNAGFSNGGFGQSAAVSSN